MTDKNVIMEPTFEMHSLINLENIVMIKEPQVTLEVINKNNIVSRNIKNHGNTIQNVQELINTSRLTKKNVGMEK